MFFQNPLKNQSPPSRQNKINELINKIKKLNKQYTHNKLNLVNLCLNVIQNG